MSITGLDVPPRFGPDITGLGADAMLRPPPQADRIADGDAFEAGERNRRHAEWLPAQSGPNLVNDKNLSVVVRRSRELARNHCIISGAMRRLADRVVGPGQGVTVRPATAWPELNRRLGELWDEHQSAIDADRCRPLSELEHVTIQELFAAGDLAVRDIVAEAWRGVPTGPAIELIPHERVPLEFSGEITEGEFAGREIRQGVEQIAGRSAALWVHVRHPSDDVLHLPAFLPFGSALSAGLPLGDPTKFPGLERLDGRTARLVHQAGRVGQVRGVPMTAAAAFAARDAKNFGEAALMQAQIAAFLGIAVEGGYTGAPKDATNSFTDMNGNPITHMWPGMVASVPRGEGNPVHVLSPALPSPNVSAFIDKLVDWIAASVGSNYAELTGDFSRTTFAAAQVGSMGTRRMVASLRQLLLARIARPAYREFVAWSITFGGVELDAEQARVWAAEPQKLFKSAPVMPGEEWVNPATEATAEDIALGNGTLTFPMIAARRGRTWADMADEQAEAERQLWDARVSRGLPGQGLAAAAATTPGQRSRAVDAERDGPPREDSDDNDQGGDQANGPIPFANGSTT
ncbi:MAG: phage portal protein [Planctomycetota bacterium]